MSRKQYEILEIHTTSEAVMKCGLHPIYTHIDYHMVMNTVQEGFVLISTLNGKPLYWDWSLIRHGNIFLMNKDLISYIVPMFI